MLQGHAGEWPRKVLTIRLGQRSQTTEVVRRAGMQAVVSRGPWWFMATFRSNHLRIAQRTRRSLISWRPHWSDVTKCGTRPATEAGRRAPGAARWEAPPEPRFIPLQWCRVLSSLASSEFLALSKPIVDLSLFGKVVR